MKTFVLIVVVAAFSLAAIAGGIFLGMSLVWHLPLTARTGPGWTVNPTVSADERAIDFQLQQACADGDVARATSSLASGAALDSSDRYGYSPLMLASANGHDDVVRLLLDKGAQIDFHTDNFTALEVACVDDRHQCAETLIDRGANCNAIAPPNVQESTPLAGAARNGDIVLQTDLLRHGANVNYANYNGTALSLAVANFRWNTIDFLISKGANPNMTDTGPYQGYTPLLETAHTFGDQASRLAQVQKLLKIGADPNIKTKSGGTALMFVCDWDWPDVAQALIHAGADVNTTAFGGETALTIAGDHGMMDMVDLLKKNGARRTDLHIIEHWRPNPPPPPDKAWALALGAMYNQRNGTNPYILGEWGDNFYGHPVVTSIQGDLQANWNIGDGSQLLKKLDYLRTTGDRADIQKEGARLAAMPDKDFAALVDTLASDPQKQARLQEVRKGYLKWKDRAGLGIDLCSSVNLINCGFAANYLSEQQSWDLLLPLARMAQKNFTSWNELGENFLDSRAMTDGSRNVALETCVQLLSNPQDPHSPWNLCPWNTDLSK